MTPQEIEEELERLYAYLATAQNTQELVKLETRIAELERVYALLVDLVCLTEEEARNV